MTTADSVKVKAREKVMFSRHHGDFLVYCNEHPSLHRRTCMDNYVKKHPDAGLLFIKYRLEIKYEGNALKVHIVDAIDTKDSFFNNPQNDSISLHKEAKKRRN